ncbi:MAG: alpha/beta hydrolase fold domain-containing protein [Chthoniobacter sp.]
MKSLPLRPLSLLSVVCLLGTWLLHLNAAPALPPGAARVVRDVAYVPNGHARQKLDLYVPVAPKGPLLVYIHGGGWSGGSKSAPMGLPLLNLGYTLASVEYRFSQDAVFPAQIEDCKSAIRWLRAHAAEYGYDPKRIAAAGDSAGGHLTALLAATGDVHDFDQGDNLDQSSAIRCGIDFYGPTDFLAFLPTGKAPDEPGKTGRPLLNQLFGGPLTEKMELARKASPVSWVNKNTAPLFILHGTKDPLVPTSQSTELCEKMKTAGVEVKLDVIDGAGHGGKEFFAGDLPQQMVDFLEKHLAQ